MAQILLIAGGNVQRTVWRIQRLKYQGVKGFNIGAINSLKTKQTHNHKLTKVGKLRCYFPQFTA